MSRSYKKVPYCGERKNREDKRNANKKVRSRLKNPNYILKGSDYKKVFESYDICDYGWFSTWKEYWEREIRYYEKWGGKKPDQKECYRQWLKWYKRK